MKSLLIISDTVEGVHLIITTDEGQDEDFFWLHNFLAQGAGRGSDWLMKHHEVDVDHVPDVVRVWPDLNAFMRQFGVTMRGADGDD